jgi:hypothetical protein
LEAQSTAQVSVYAVGDTLVMGDPPNTVVLSLVDDNEPNWQWRENEAMSAISSDDFALLVDCDVTQLPRIIGSGTSQSSEGTPIEFTYRLIAWSMADTGANMFGSLAWVGGGITQKRVVSLTPH